jgi:hypothetical protein
VHCTDPKADVGDGALNRLYKGGINLRWPEAYCGFSSLKTSKILDLMTSINSVDKFPSKKHLCFTLVCESIVNNKMIITDESKFVSEVSKLDSKLEQDSRNKQVQDEKSGPTVKANYYFEQMRLNWNGDYRKRRQSTIWNEIVTQPSVYGIQFPVQNAAK